MVENRLNLDEFETALQKAEDADEFLKIHERLELNDVRETNRRLGYSDVYEIGKLINSLKNRLIRSQSKNLSSLKTGHDEFDSVDKREASIELIIQEIATIEIMLCCFDICPTIQSQLKNERRDLARKYIKKDAIAVERQTNSSNGYENMPSNVHVVGTVDAMRMYNIVTEWENHISNSLENVGGITASRSTKIDVINIVNNPNVLQR